MSSTQMSLAILAAAAIGGGATWLVLSGERAAPVLDDPDQPIAEPPPAPPPEAGAPVEPVEPIADGTGDGMLELPDGTHVPPLNGTVDPPKLVWNNPQWSPIVGKVRSNGIEWYRHADGSHSTTLMLWRSDLGRHDAFSYSLHPRDPAPTRPLPGQQPGKD